MAARFVHAGVQPGRGLAAPRVVPRGIAPGALVLAAALPILFLHVSYQPALIVRLGGASATAYLSDFAVLAVVVAALATGTREGFSRLRAGRALWLAGGAFLVWVAVSVGYGGAVASGYARTTHAVSAAKFAEYALLAPASVLLLRRLADIVAILWSLTLCCAAALVVAIAQFFGADVALATAAGRREASFVGFSDFAALAVAVTLVGVVALADPRLGLGRRLGATAAVVGVLGTILAGSVAGVLGVLTAFVVLVAVLAVRRQPLRPALLVAIPAAVVLGLGALTIRGNDLETFARFTGASTAVRQSDEHRVQTYSQRSLLAWIGYRIWLGHPLLGVGWEGSEYPAGFRPVLPAAHLRFPSVAEKAFPAARPDRRYGVQNSWVQALADLGVVGLGLWIAVFAAAAVTALRGRSAPALLGLTGVAALLWLWTAQGFYAGIPLDAATAVLFGLAAARRSATES